EGLRVGVGYLLSPEYDEATVRRIAAGLLCDPVVQSFRIGAPGQPLDPPSSARHRVLVQRRPGVMDPIATTVDELLVKQGLVPDSGQPGVGTYSAWEFGSELSSADLALAASKVLANETIEVVRIDREELPYGTPFPTSSRGRVEIKFLGADDNELERLSKEGQLSLTLIEMLAVQAHFKDLGREPSACELETVAQTWSEHCKHKTLTGIIEFEGPDGNVELIDNLLKSTIAKATHTLDRPWCLSVFVDNAGIIEFDQGQALAIKVETHNHPSAIDPYGGAGTGIGGVIRDLLGAGLGALPIANTDCFFVGPMDLPREAVPKGSMHPRRILRGVVDGVRDYGNRMGIPTVSGGVWFDEGYTSNPLVYAGTIGLLPSSMAQKDVQPGDVIVAAGGRTGRDGIHGATFSSIELSEESEEISGASVQIGDPITEKRVQDCLLQARDLGLYRGITDCGAGGFSSAVGEMGEHTGCEVELDQVPLKYAGLSSHEIWISEAQERMVMAVPPEKVEQLLAVFAAEDVEATVIGTFTDSGQLVVKDGGEVVADLSMSFLHDGTPRPTRKAVWRAPDLPDPGCPRSDDFEAVLLALLCSPNIASKEWIVRQYDHEVQGTSVVKPLVGVKGDGPGDAAVIKPLATSNKGAAIACGANPKYGVLDPYAMTAAAIDEALRNVTAVGADPDQAAILDNFSWGNCDKPDRLGSLVLASKACHDAAMAYRTPFVSGKDSLNNEYRVGDRTLSIPPTMLITALAIVPEVGQSVTMDLKRAGNRLYLVGATDQELGGSHYLAHLGLAGGRVPTPDLESAPALLRLLHEAMRNELVASCHDLSEGGLATAAAEMAFAGELGATIELAQIPIKDGADEACNGDAMRLFSETCTRFLVEVSEDKADTFEAVLAEMPCAAVGHVVADQLLTIHGVDGAPLIKLPLTELRSAHQGGFQG
ncbi:MAG: phosphoribosylformylglycinamidine synthase II, partial [Gammaproteobacteria bacterium]